MPALKLLALDPEDLQVLSAHVQDAVLRVGDIDWRAHEKRVVIAMNRFVWEAPRRLFRRHDERRRAALHFDRVMAVKATGIDRDKPAEVLSLLAVRFVETQAPAGHVDLVFSGGATMRLDVECIEARLSDIGGAWEATSRPAHRV
ncbi:DUF2948 family protein [Aquibium carbonis]|uniref:DUF2948 family protein n=1 Tax=Aquibium carbonis TaxID=2495581 RepID=A0A3R9Y7V9_9HYPH|nr:DUF2948 family protein [Aquibium carbonis]RST85184.1 DUF2948 family protein [Aquibium carbonis]